MATEAEIAAFLAAECPPATNPMWRLHLAATKAVQRKGQPLTLADLASLWDQATRLAETASSISPLYWLFKSREQKQKVIDKEQRDVKPEAGHAAGGRVIRGTKSLGG